MDERLRSLLQRLGNTINESLSDSDPIAEVMGELKKEGYEVYIIMEATIGFAKSDESSDTPITSLPGPIKPPAMQFTDSDNAFLRALKIVVQD